MLPFGVPSAITSKISVPTFPLKSPFALTSMAALASAHPAGSELRKLLNETLQEHPFVEHQHDFVNVGWGITATDMAVEFLVCALAAEAVTVIL